MSPQEKANQLFNKMYKYQIDKRSPVSWKTAIKLATISVDEFKNMFPEKAHLEGDALWNAMEDYQYSIQDHTPKKLMDWMGNLVKEGDTVIVVRTRSFICGDIFMHEFNSGKEPVKIGRIPDNFIWDILNEAEIILFDGRLMYESKYGETTWVMDAIMLSYGQPTDIICIKGVSDDKEKFIQFSGGVYSETS